MAKWKYYYIVRIEFLGFRYHGWQKQKKLPSVQGQIDKTFSFIFGHDDFKTLGCGRTDAKVSADDFAFELFVNHEHNCQELMTLLNTNLPPDIRTKNLKVTDETFNIIKDSKTKEYHYTFCFGTKPHPYNTPFVTHLGKNINIKAMTEAALCFKGTHNFKRYVAKSSEKDSYLCLIEKANIEKDTKFIGQFSHPNTYVFKVKAKGFMRYQVRLMMGALIELGNEECSFDSFKTTMVETTGLPIKTIAPSSALTLVKVDF